VLRLLLAGVVGGVLGMATWGSLPAPVVSTFGCAAKLLSWRWDVEMPNRMEMAGHFLRWWASQRHWRVPPGLIEQCVYDMTIMEREPVFVESVSAALRAWCKSTGVDLNYVMVPQVQCCSMCLTN